MKTLQVILFSRAGLLATLTLGFQLGLASVTYTVAVLVLAEIGVIALRALGNNKRLCEYVVYCGTVLGVAISFIGNVVGLY